MLQRVSQKKRERERKRERDTHKRPGDLSLTKQRCFNDFSMSIYKLWYKKLLSEMRDQKTKRTATVTKGTRGNVSHKVRRQSISRKGKETKQFCPKENVY